MKKLIGLVRVSTGKQRDSGGGIEAQIHAITIFAEQNGYELSKIVRETESGGASLEDRPVLQAVLEEANKTGSVIVVNKLDRLSRKSSFIGLLLDKKVKFAVTDLGGEEVDPFILHIMAALAEKERKMISQRTSAALQALKARGKILGNTRNIAEARVLAAKANSEKADEFADKLKPTINRMLNMKMSLTQIAAELNANGTKTARGGQWAATTVRNLTNRWE